MPLDFPPRKTKSEAAQPPLFSMGTAKKESFAGLTPTAGKTSQNQTKKQGIGVNSSKW
jgi:hypothetical protein